MYSQKILGRSLMTAGWKFRFVWFEDMIMELQSSWGANAVMSSCDDGHVHCFPRYIYCTVCVAVFFRMKHHASVRKQRFQFAWATKGWRTSLTQSSCVCVCYSGSAISLECSASCQREVTTMVCTHNTAETRGWLKKAWKWGDAQGRCKCVSAVCNCDQCFRFCNTYASSLQHFDAWIFKITPTVMKSVCVCVCVCVCVQYGEPSAWTLHNTPMSIINWMNIFREGEASWHFSCLPPYSYVCTVFLILSSWLFIYVDPNFGCQPKCVNCGWIKGCD